MTYIKPMHDDENTNHLNARFIADMDRCVHGRHVGDACNECPAQVSCGNPRMLGKDPRTPDGRAILGYSLSGTYAYVLVPLEDYSRGGHIIELVRQ